jgi:uncharacterized protein YbjT (DUF2867 family)
MLPRFELAVAAGGRETLLRGPAALAPEPGREQLVGEVSHAAEAFGIHPGMRLGEALARCPRLALVPPDPVGVADGWERVVSALEAIGAGVATGDLLDRASLDRACEGIRTVVCTATAIARLLGGAGGPSLREVDDKGVGNLVAAAEHAGVERFVYISYTGVGLGLGFPLERAKTANEERLQRSSLRAVIVRPDAFQEVHLAPLGQFDIAAGKVGILGRGDTRRRWVATDDVAALVAAVALEPDPPEVIEVGGPDAVSRNEAVELVEGITGRKLKVRRMPRPLVRLAMRLLARGKPALASVFGLGLMMDLEESRCDETALSQRRIEPKSARDYLREEASRDVSASGVT